MKSVGESKKMERETEVKGGREEWYREKKGGIGGREREIGIR